MSVIRIVIGDMTQVYAEVEGCVSDQRVRGNSFSIPVLIQYSKMFFLRHKLKAIQKYLYRQRENYEASNRQ